MIPYILDISDYVESMSFSQDEINSFAKYTLDNFRNEYMQIWEQLVDRGLKGTRQQYRNGMSYKYLDDYNIVFKLEGKEDSKLALMLEEGASPFDQKQFFEKSSKKKFNKEGGWYMNIPMRLATSEALAESGIFAGKMPKPIQDLVKKQPVNKTTGFSIGLSRDQLPKEFQKTDIKKQIGTMTNTYEHKSPMFEGVMRGTKKNHGQYLKFRTIGENSDENAWYHPGFQPHKFMDKAMDIFMSQSDQIYERSKKEFLTL